MNHDLALIAAVLESRDIRKALEAGAKLELLGDEAGVYWETLLSYHDRFYEVPSLVMFESLHPGYEHHPPQDSIEALVHELKTQHVGCELDEVLRRTAELNLADPWEARKLLSSEVDRLATFSAEGEGDLVVGANISRILKTVERIKGGGGLLGYPWPWSPLNEGTAGVMKGQAFYFYGRQKNKKTWVLLQLALYYVSVGLKVLFFTREMSQEELEWRVGAMACGLDYGQLLKGRVTQDGLDYMEQVMKEIFNSGNFIISSKADGVQGFKAKIEEIRPHIVIHDYVMALAEDAMGDNFRGDEHRYIARVVNQIVSYMKDKAKIPCFFCGHANREGVKGKGKSTTEHAGSDNITRRVDGAFRVISNRAEAKIAIIVNAGRAFPENIGFTINGNTCHGFGDVIATDTKWVKDYDETEDEEEDSKTRTGAQSPSPTSTTPSKFKPGQFRAKFKKR